MSSDEASAEDVNPHDLDHVIHVSESRAVEAAEDIVSQNGIKLLAKGAQINDKVRERLLMHKLQKPLEDCIQVKQGVMPESFGPWGEALFEQHPLLKGLRELERESLLRAGVLPPEESGSCASSSPG